MNTYDYLIKQTFDFPNQEFRLEKDVLHFNNISIMELIEQYDTPLKITYLPKIGQKIHYAQKLFRDAMAKLGYNGSYNYCYCTKASHFHFVVEEVLKNNTELETSSACDIAIVRSLYQKQLIDKEKMILCNGFKPEEYLADICHLINEGFKKCIPIIDHTKEIDYYLHHIQRVFSLGIRIAADEEPNFGFYTSRLGVRYNQVIEFYQQKIATQPNCRLSMLHFFINSGIKDSQYYWYELNKFIDTYCELKKICPDLKYIDIGGGFPIKTSLNFDFDHEYMTEEIIKYIQWQCRKNNVSEPDIITEFGTYTVGESGAIFYKIIDTKVQNDKELWYMIDGSFITHLPDTWAKSQKFILLAANHWNEQYQKVHLGGLTCDSDDYYNSEMHSANIYLPKIPVGKHLYIGLFHTGAYQDNLAGFGGIQHCLIPSPKHLVIRKNKEGYFQETLFCHTQGKQSILKHLGY